MKPRKYQHSLEILLPIFFTVLASQLGAQPTSFDGDKALESYDTLYAQEYNPTAGWDRFKFYGQWNALMPSVFNASDISTGALQFKWIEKRVICSRKKYTQPYVFETDLEYATASNRAGVVIRIANLTESIQEPESDPGFNREGIAFYPTLDGSSMIVQFSGEDKGYSSGMDFARILVPKPDGITNLMERGTLRIEDFGSTIYVYYNGAPYIRIELEGESEGIFTSGTVYDTELQLMGSFTGLEIELSGHVAVASRDAVPRLYGASIEYNDPSSQDDTTIFPSPYRDLYEDTWVATDALGRTMPDYEEVGPLKDDKRRMVGIFYITWHTEGHNSSFPSPFSADVTKILEADPSARFDANHPLWGRGTYSFHWGEPEVGYFLSQDEYVIRNDMAMLANAGVDVLVLDVTNAVRYWDEWEVLFNTMQKMKAEGNKVPQFCFWAFNGPVINVVQDLYDWFYKRESYKDLWYYWDDKPLLLYNANPDPAIENPNPNYDPDAQTNPANPHYGDPYYTEEFLTDYTQEVKDFFTKRNMWWGYYEWQGERYVGTEDNWSFGYDLNDDRVKAMSPDDLIAKHNGINEQAATCPAQHPSSLVGKSWRRKTGEPMLDEYDLPEPAYVPWLDQTVENPEGYGIYFQDRWDEAIASDPDFMYINDWNEWSAGKYHDGAVNPFMRRSSPYYFVDQYNAEFNRAVQPMKDGYTDNYYMQMAQNIRRYKGVRSRPIQSGINSIGIDHDFSDWEAVSNEFLDAIGDIRHRDHNGYGGLHYTNETGRNDIMSSKVAYDNDSLYFYVKTVYDLSPSEDPNWMLLFIDIDRSRVSGWEGYDYVINHGFNSPSQTTLKRWTGLSWGDEIAIPIAISGSELELSIPRSVLMLDEGTPEFFFKWADNPQHLNDITGFFTDGESAPDRRFNYNFSTSAVLIEAQTSYKELNIPGTIEVEDFDKGSAGVAYADAVYGNSGGAYRTDESVDIREQASNEYCITDMYSNEWLEYTVDVKSIGVFSVDLTYAADSVNQEISLLTNNRPVINQLQLPETGTENDWTTITFDVTLNAGVQVLKILAENATGGLHIDKMVFTEKEIFLPGSGTGLYRSLYNGKPGGRGWFTDSMCSEVDLIVDYEWAEDESPGCEVNSTFWNARWQGYIEALFSEEYTIHLTINDKGKLWLGGDLLIDAWVGAFTNTTQTVSINMTSGEKMPVKIEYANATGNGNIKLEWESATQERQVIPQSQLYPLNTVTSLNEKEFSVPLIYPNPASDLVYLEISKDSKVEIFTVSGKQVYQDNTKSGLMEIDVRTWKAGIYIIKILGDSKIYSGKLMIE
jgi:hypothetical protein